MSKWCFNYDFGEYEWIEKDVFCIDQEEHTYHYDAIDFVCGTLTIKHTVTSMLADGKMKVYIQDSAKTQSSMRTLSLVGSFVEYFGMSSRRRS